MKTLILTSIVAALAFTSSAHAQIIWGPMNPITGDSDINTNGTFVDAINTIYNGTYTTTTIGDETFNALTSVSFAGPVVTASDGIITDVITQADGNFNNHGYSGGSADYEYIQNNGSDVSSATVTITGLVPNAVYQIQTWAYWPGPYNANIDGTYVDGSSPVTFTEYSGSQAVGLFVPTSSTFTFNYEQNHDSNGGFLDDIAIREVPEPSSWAMIVGGVGVLLFVGRLRRVVRLN